MERAPSIDFCIPAIGAGAQTTRANQITLGVSGSTYTLAGLTTGQTVRVRITAANDAGESQPGDTVEIVVP